MRLTSDLVGDGNELRRIRFEEGTTLPINPFLGQLFHLHVSNSVSKVFYYDGVQWICGVTSLNGKQGDIVLDTLELGLEHVNNTSDIDKPISTATADALSLNSVTDRNRANHTGVQLSSTISDFNNAADVRIELQKDKPHGVAELDGNGKILTTELPAIAITTVSVVNNQEAQISLPTQEGDVVIRSDLSATFIRNAGMSGTMSDWTQLANPLDPVLSVNNMTGSVTITAADLGLEGYANTKANYVHTQENTQTVWTITHNLGYDPAGVIVMSTDGYMLDGFGVQYLTTGASLRISFDLSFSGTAILS